MIGLHLGRVIHLPKVIWLSNRKLEFESRQAKFRALLTTQHKHDFIFTENNEKKKEICDLCYLLKTYSKALYYHINHD